MKHKLTIIREVQGTYGGSCSCTSPSLSLGGFMGTREAVWARFADHIAGEGAELERRLSQQHEAWLRRGMRIRELERRVDDLERELEAERDAVEEWCTQFED